MSSDAIISIQGLGKRYNLGTSQRNGHYTALRDVIANSARNLFRRKPAAESGPSDPREFWALKNVSLEVKRGEVLGIIGRNGAGKSTLLKILSRITEPTEGRIELHGRVASLLEVGTGFHPELTGRENIFLNGAILGMHRQEIRAKFDEIVAFAEVEKFLDTPVKRYSSGMYVRLAFAVAAHLEPEILIVDEVLAVGDAEFQKKCLGKMRDVATGQGRTVLFVSHNMGAVEQLCSRVIMLEHGNLTRDSSDLRSVIRDYLFSSLEAALSTEWRNPGEQYPSSFFLPLRFRLTNAAGHTLDNPLPGDAEIWVEFEAFIEESNPLLSMGIAIYTEDSETVFWSYQTDLPAEKWPATTKGAVTLRSRLPARLFNQGLYRIELIAGIHGRLWILEPEKGSPTIFLRIQGGLSDSPLWNYRRPGFLAPVLPWEPAPLPAI